MKYRYLLIGLLSTLALSCTVSEIYAPEGPEEGTSPKKEVFYVSIDEQPGAETKVYADENLRVLWNHDDRISIFNQSTYNREYRFEGETGANSGEITPVGAAGSGDPLELIYAVYPYQDSTSINNNGIVTFTLPDIQTYEPNSFGIEANTMISVTDTNEILKFKNVGGYLAFKLCGPGVKVSSITLHGTKNEPLAGPATIQMTSEGPVVSIDASNPNTVSSKIKLYCKEPVELGSDPTVFWFVVPPVEFANGFSVTVATPDGATFTQSTSKPFSVRRSTVTRMASFTVEPTGSINASLTSVTSTRPVAKSDGTSTTKTYTANFDGDRTFTILLPTVTDLSNNVTLNYSHTGDKLLANGQEIHPGDTINATGLETALVLCKGDAEKRYTLKVTNTGLPVVRITTVDFDRTTVEGDETHETWYGYDKKNYPKRHAYIRIDMPNGDPGMIDKDGKAVNVVETQIKGRGNATWTYPKRPYALKLDKKTGIRYMSSDGSMPAHKRWILLANWKDRTLLRNDAALWLSRQTKERTGSEDDTKLGLPYTVRGQFVELEFNGEHRGNYYLCEQIKIDPERVAITEMAEKETGEVVPNNITGGYLVEIDNNWDEQNSFNSGVFNFKYQFKIPDEKDRTTQAYNYMTSFIDTVETKIYALRSNPQNNDYKDFFDIDSAIWFMFVQELTGNGDFFNHDQQWAGASSQWYGPHSTYFYKDRNTFDPQGNMVRSKLHMGPVWDFDYLTFMPSRSSQWVGVDQKKYYFNFLLNDTAFKSRMTTLWSEYYPGLSDDFATYVSGVAETIRVSQGFDAEMWWTKSGDQTQNKDYNCTFDEAVTRVKTALKDKIDWMNENNRIGKLKYQTATVP